MAIVRSISGLRAQFGSGLTPNLISNYAYSLHKVIKSGKIVIGKDGRLGSEWIEKVLVGTFESLGRDLEILGTVPTPTVQFVTEKTDAVAGIVITASHNPQDWCGLKFLDENGVFLNQEMNEKLWKVLDSNEFNYPELKLGKTIYSYDVIDKHIKSCLDLEIIKNSNVIVNISKRNLKVVVDAVNASGSVIVPKLLEKLNYKVITINCDNSGIFPHTPEPIPANLTELANKVKIEKADFGVAVDPDADRLVLIDENGEPIGEEKTIVLAAKAVFEFYQNKENLVATVNLSTSNMIVELAKQYGAKIEHSPVGEINVVEKMKVNGSIIGGEGSGGVIFPKAHYGRDSLVGISLVSYILSNTNKTFSEICNELPKFEMIKTKQDFSGDFNQIKVKVTEIFKDDKLNFDDGIRIDLVEAWVQIRKSNTEPIIRIIAEAKTQELAQSLIDKIANII